MRLGRGNIMVFRMLSLMFVALLAACGSSGGGGSTPATTQTPTASTVSGVAATGAAMVGTVSLMDSSGTSSERSQPINADGSFSFIVDGLKPPFILEAKGTSGGTNYTLYSIANGPGIANINPFSNLAVCIASGKADPVSLYSNLDATAVQTILTNLPQATSDLQAKLQPLLTPFSATGNPISDIYSVNHQGLDGVLDMVKIDMSATGTITITNKTSNATIYTGQMNNFKNGTITTASLPHPTYSISGTITAGGSALAGATVSTSGARRPLTRVATTP
jgi:hypothetical protein